MSCLRGPTSANHKDVVPPNYKDKQNSVIHGSTILFVMYMHLNLGALDHMVKLERRGWVMGQPVVGHCY